MSDREPDPVPMSVEFTEGGLIMLAAFKVFPAWLALAGSAAASLLRAIARGTNAAWHALHLVKHKPNSALAHEHTNTLPDEIVDLLAASRWGIDATRQLREVAIDTPQIPALFKAEKHTR